MTALGRLPQFQAERALKHAGKTQVEVKARQRTSGRSGQLNYLVENSVDFDLVDALPPLSSPHIDGFKYELTFTSESSWPIVSPVYEMYVNGTAESNRVKPDNMGTPRWQASPGSNNQLWLDAFGGNDLAVDTSTLEEEKRLRWIMEGYYSGTLTVRLKIFLYASSPGTLIVRRVAP